MKERIEYIDIAKGIGILLVIAGHLFAYRGPISRWIFSFHMQGDLIRKKRKEDDTGGKR